MIVRSLLVFFSIVSGVTILPTDLHQVWVKVKPMEIFVAHRSMESITMVSFTS